MAFRVPRISANGEVAALAALVRGVAEVECALSQERRRVGLAEGHAEGRRVACKARPSPRHTVGHCNPPGIVPTDIARRVVETV